MINYIIIDTETTGLPTRGTWPKIISIGIIHCSFVNNELEIYSEKEFYINDWVDDFEENTQKFLNLNKEYVKKHGIQFSNVVNYILELVNSLTNIVFVAHNVEFDKNVLKTCGLDLTKYTWLCTMKLSYRLFNKYARLQQLAEYYNIPVDSKKCHTALYDTRLCAHILYAMLTNSFDSCVYEKRELNLRNRTIEYMY